MLVTGSGPLKSEISVRSLDPALMVSKSVLPSKLPTMLLTGSFPTGKVFGFVSSKNTPPAPGRKATSFEPLFVTRMSGGLWRREFADNGRYRAQAARREPRSGCENEVRLVDQDRYFIRALVGDDQVGIDAAGEVGDGDTDGVVPTK